ncbi:hypothetical protein l13_02440 [Neisseria weaveri ATCC 51223]|nr:hypothetical protein l13_02440 [Neisseria weaveri ATCC 51223]
MLSRLIRAVILSEMRCRVARIMERNTGGRLNFQTASC